MLLMRNEEGGPFLNERSDRLRDKKLQHCVLMVAEMHGELVLAQTTESHAINGSQSVPRWRIQLCLRRKLRLDGVNHAAGTD